MTRLFMSLKSYKTWLFIGYALIVLCLSSLNSGQLPKIKFFAQNDKLIHFVEYLIFGFLLVNAMEFSGYSRKLRFISFAIILLFPVLDETLQSVIPGRFPEVMDGLFDVIGGLIGSIIYFQWKNVKITSY